MGEGTSTTSNGASSGTTGTAAPPPGTGTGAGDGKGAPPAPEAFKLKVPEGSKVAPEFEAAYGKLVGDLGLAPDTAQTLFETYLGQEAKAAKAEAEALKAQEAEWRSSLAKDEMVVKLGGLDKAEAVVDRAVAKFGGPELAKMLAESGLRHHPALFRFAAGVGALLKEGTTEGAPTGGAGGDDAKAAIRARYGLDKDK